MSEEPGGIPESPEKSQESIKSPESPKEPTKEEVMETPKRTTRPKTNVSTLEACRFDYEIGNFKSVTELAERYGINHDTLHQRIIREDWEKSRLNRLAKLETKMEKIAVNIGEEYLKNTFLRAKKYEKLIDVSIQNRTKKDSEGNPMLDPDDLNSYTLTESRIHDIAKSALRIPDAKAIDITTKGESLGESLVQAIAKLRDNKTAVNVTMEQADQIAEYEIIKTEPK